MSKVRTRFAPSPTGRMHVGNLRTALYAYLIAKHEGGDFILRIEDTDQERYVEGALDIIYHTLKETGLVHDEGPDLDGGVGPYVQSERQAQGIYLKYAKELVEKGEAYYCFCGKERLESLKQEVAGKEIRAIPYMHWWTFFGYFMESGECLFNTVVGIRSKKVKGERLDKWEKKFYQENKNIIDIKTRLSEEEQAYKDALNEMLNLK